MSFYLSKILWLIFSPFNLLIYIFFISFILFFLKKKKISYFLFFISFCIFNIFSVFPLGKFLIYNLEKNYHDFIIPENVDGILILGGATNPFLTDQFNQINLNNSSERLIESIKLIKKYNNAKVVFSGGLGSIEYPKLSHAKVAERFFTELGLPINKIKFEYKSRNTYENILFSKKIVKPKQNEKWILITSAFHMNRAMFIGEKNNWNFIPYAVDFRQPKKIHLIPNLNFMENISQLQLGAHEWIGLVSYYFMGRTKRIL